MTGQSFDTNTVLIACYLVSGSEVTTIAYPAGTQTTVHVINDLCVLVGAHTDAAGKRHGFTYASTTGTYSGPIDAPKAAVTGLLGINKTRTVSGSATPASGVAAGLVGVPVQ